MGRKEILNEIFSEIDKNQKKLLGPLIDEVIFLEEQMSELKKLPFIIANPKNSAQQRKTEAAKLYKECSQSYMNAIRILCLLLRKSENGEDDPVAKFMENLNSG